MPGHLAYGEMSRMTADKETFFRGLEQLDSVADESESEFDRLIASSRLKNEVTLPVSGDSFPSENPSLQSHPRAVIQPPSDASVADSVPIVSRGETHEHNQPKTMGGPGSRRTATSDVPGKRKRGSVGKVIPEEQQIFKGLVFFFFPNSDVSPLRRLRIQRAQEYGALWAKAWGDSVTHVIVDKGLKYEEILKHLKLDIFPPTIALVDECYPSECIKFRCVLNVSQLRFQVNGVPTSTSPEVEEQVAAPSGSLPLKAPRKEQQQTQTSSQNVHEEANICVLDSGPQVECPKETAEEVPSVPLPARERDALDEMIEEAKGAIHLPLDPLDSPEDDASVEGRDDGGTSDDSDTQQMKQKKRRLLQREEDAVESWQQKFACMQKHDESSSTGNANARTIEVLQQMLDYYTRTSDHWRMLAYRRAISALRNQPKRVVTRTQALAIPGIGARLADKIEEIVFTNRLRRLENTSNTAEDRILQEFLGIYGAGLSHASRWIALGYKSLGDLRTNATLTRTQRIGVERYYDFSQRIPRSEVEAHGDIVRQVVQQESPEMQVIIGGSYRRGAADSGDIDLIITKPDATIEEIRALMMDIVVPKLFQQGFLQAGLATTSREDGSKWHGASKLPGNQLWRRIDLLFVPGEELGAALIYFTGNDIFNRSIRLLASKKSMRLNQRGLYADVARGPQRAKLNTGRLVESRDERRIFEILGVPWRPPEHRIC